MERKSFLQFPRATEGIHLEDAYRHRILISVLDEMFIKWGYLPVETPAFDFFDTYRPLLQGKDLEKVFRLIDRDGDLLMLRSDITLFLAKQVGIALREEDLPVRTCYSGVVLRHQNEEDISNNEFFQVGAELIGRPGKDGDLEILLLILDTLKTLDISARIHLGSRAFLDAATKELKVLERKDFAEAVRSRDRNTMIDVLTRYKSGTVSQTLTDLFLFIGTPGEYASLLKNPRIDELHNAEKQSLQYLLELTDVLTEIEASPWIRIDLSEIGSQPYYSGIVFQGYMDRIDSAFLSGGRYDELMSRFGLSAASVGFSFFLRKIEPYLGQPERFSLTEKILTAPGTGFLERYRNAEKMRRSGKKVIL